MRRKWIGRHGGARAKVNGRQRFFPSRADGLLAGYDCDRDALLRVYAAPNYDYLRARKQDVQRWKIDYIIYIGEHCHSA